MTKQQEDAIAAELLAIELDLSMPTGAIDAEGMIVSNLKPLVWEDHKSGTASESRSALHEYDAWQTDDDTGWVVGYFDRRNPTGIKEATGFSTIEEAKEWAWNHYNEKMQPYIKLSPTWTDVNERLPEYKEKLSDKDKCLVLTECGKVWTGYYNTNIKPDGWYLHGWHEKQGWHPFSIIAWMPTSKLKKQGE